MENSSATAKSAFGQSDGLAVSSLFWSLMERKPHDYFDTETESPTKPTVLERRFYSRFCKSRTAATSPRSGLSLQCAGFLVEALGTRVQRDRQVLGSGFQLDVLGSGVSGAQAVQVVEHQVGHLVGHFIGNAFMADQDVGDGDGGDVGVLTVVGAGRNGGGLVGGVVDLRGAVGRGGSEADLHGRTEV